MFAPEGRRLETHGPFGVRLWHVANGRLYPLPPRHADSPLATWPRTKPRFSRDGRRLVAPFADGRIRHWDMPDAPATFREMQLRTWVDLVARLNDQGVVEPIPWEEWRELRDELRVLPTNASPPSS